MGEFIIKDISGLAYENGKAYMISPYVPCVMAYDFEMKKTEKVCDYPHNVTEKAAFEKIVKYGTKIYLFPCLADSIYCYDTLTKTYTSLLPLHSIVDKIPVRKFFEVLTYHEIIYAVCRSPQFVIRINPVDNDVRIWKCKQQILVPEETELVNFSMCAYDNKLVYPYAADILMQFDMCTETFEVIHLERKGDDYEEKYRCLLGMAISDTGKKWVFDWYGNVYGVIRNKMSKLELPPELNGLYDDGQYGETPRINALLTHEGKLYILLQSDHRILTYDIEKECFSWIPNSLAVWRKARKRLAYVTYAQADTDAFLLHNYNDGKIYVWDLRSGFLNQIELRIILNDALDSRWMKDYVLGQGDLELYIKYIAKRHSDQEEKQEECLGNKIYSFLSSEENM